MEWNGGVSISTWSSFPSPKVDAPEPGVQTQTTSLGPAIRVYHLSRSGPGPAISGPVGLQKRLCKGLIICNYTPLSAQRLKGSLDVFGVRFQPYSLRWSICMPFMAACASWGRKKKLASNTPGPPPCKSFGSSSLRGAAPAADTSAPRGRCGRKWTTRSTRRPRSRSKAPVVGVKQSPKDRPAPFFRVGDFLMDVIVQKQDEAPPATKRSKWLVT